MKGSRGFILISAVLIFSAFAGFIITFNWFHNSLEDDVNSKISQELNEVGKQSKKIIETKIEDLFQELESISIYLGNLKNINGTEAESFLKLYQENNNYGNIGIITIDGMEYRPDGEIIDISDYSFFHEAFKGNRTVSDVIYTEENETPMVVIGVPIKKNDRIIGVLSNTCEVSLFNELMGEKIYDDGRVLLMQKNGTIITEYEGYLKSSNIYSYLEGFELENAVSIEAFVNSVKNDHTDLLIYNKDGSKFYLQYLPLEISDWYLLINTSSASMELHLDKIGSRGYQLLILTSSYLMILIIFILIVLYVNTKRMKMNNLELMVTSKELKESEERFRIISEQTYDILYEFNFETHNLFISPTFKKKFGYELTYNNIKNCLSLHPEDANKFRMMIKRVYHKSNYGVCEVRLRNISGKYIWCSLHNTIIMNEGKISKMIGKIVDIDKRKKDIENLTELSKRDPLTKVYNKVTIQEMIDDYFDGEGKEGRHAFIFLDIDNFKAINDNLGHSFGDNVLAELSTALKEIYAGNNFIGRIGGDEFVALLKDIGSINVVIEKAEEICCLLRNTYTGENNDYSISASIGITVYPDDGSDYYELYTKADEALYEAKSAGKNQYIIYDSSPMEIQLINISQ